MAEHAKDNELGGEELPQEEQSSEKTGFLFSSKVYDILKPVTTTVLPGIATFYVTLGQTWGLPATDKVTATIVALNTLLGALLLVSSKNFKKSDVGVDGKIVTTVDENGTKRFVLELNSDPYLLEDQQLVTFKMEANPDNS